MSSVRPPRKQLRRRAHDVMVAKRRPIVVVHRWLSFVLVAWIALEGVTGAAIVFGDDIDRLANREAYRVTAGDIGVAEAIAADSAERPGDIVRFAWAPGSEVSQGTYRIQMVSPDGDNVAVLVDPGSGTVNSADHHPPWLLGVTQQLHFNLNSSSLFGFEPLSVLGWMSVGWIALLISGFYLWYWPGVRRWARSVRVRRERGWFTFNLDLHKALGFVVFVPLLLVAITGIDFAFPGQVRVGWDALTFGAYQETPVETDLSEPSKDLDPIGANRAVEIVSSIDPNARIMRVDLPGGSPVGVYRVHAKVDSSFFGTAGGSREVDFSIDQYRGSVLAVHDPADAAALDRAYDEWSYNVHVGNWGGTTTRIMWLALGLSPLLLGATGIAMWTTRRRRRTRRRTNEAHASPEVAHV